MNKPVSTIVRTVLFFAGWAAVISFTPDGPFSNPAIRRLWWEFAPLAAAALFTVLFVRFIERGRISVPLAPQFFKNTLLGIAAGTLWLGSAVAVLLLTDTMAIHSRNEVAYIWIWILASLLNVAMQELLVRGYLYQLWKHRSNRLAAAAVTTLLFVLMHGGAFEAGIIPVLNVVTMSIFMTLLLEYTGTLIAPVLAHFVWNTAGAVILGGVSLAGDYPNLYNSSFQGSALLSGGGYAIEGSVVVLIINIALITGVLVLNRTAARYIKAT
ncbi:CPBP family intramembrane glutamic endopeptidase [Paenibacillus camerounensis]|uniref:CPBP family intramembrane glutamic endopeptidase n=1 Tax=Paenibacillus camerounensis TaxID=1243663 RepID=UPI0005A85674|nr:CPBP family intramembrane glutamic endopeptidase [Paenibacillus camerounensis]